MIGNYIKEARKKAGFTQEELGKAIGISGVAIMRYEKGQREPGKEILEKISSTLNVNPNELMGWDKVEKYIKDDQIFIAYLESIGYKYEDNHDSIEDHEEEMVDDNGNVLQTVKVADKYDESPDAPCGTLIKDGIISSFTNQQFNDFKSDIVKTVEFHTYKYRKK